MCTVKREEIHDIDLSLHFKHGKHTIFLFVDPMKPFSDISDELLEIMKERFPQGLTTSDVPLKTTKIPKHASQIEYALPKVPLDPSQGWTPLKVQEGETPVEKGIKDYATLAFAIRPEGAGDDEDLDFEILYPIFDDEEENAEDE
ncbi:hypothetical protein F4778DRAFT_784123 [Xylariomycetidae sp. FL2044]|nr:hypothetical protein F4778DRAFT_784123 [Xylariomycetidae sp. FL2044]